MKIDFKSIIDSLAVPAFIIDTSHTVLAWNAACERLTGKSEKEMIGGKEAWSGFYDSIRPCLVDLVVEGADIDVIGQMYLLSGQTKFTNGAHAETWLTTFNGKKRYLSIDAATLLDEHGQVIAGIETLEDITEEKEIEARLMLSDKVFTYTTQAIMITDSTHHIIQCNDSFTRLTGYQLSEVKGKSSGVLQSGRHDDEFFAKMQKSLDKNGHWEGEVWDKRKNGAIYCMWVAINAVHDPQTQELSHYISIFSDITERKQSEDEIRYIAFHDELTDLPNRILFHERLESAIKAAKRKSSMLALMFLDLDGFKAVNDSYGHDTGDLLLKEIAKRLKHSVRETDTVARLGGDEFMIIVSDIEHESDVSKLASKILTKLNLPIHLANTQLYTPPSIGIALFPMDGMTSETLIKSADTAMYEAKQKGKNNFRYFTHAMTEASHERSELEHDLRLAIEHDELELHYQPKVSAFHQRVVGCEALLRWNRKGEGYFPPSQFIGIAEDAGLMLSLGEWVIKRAIYDMSLWQKSGMPDLLMSVNISARQLSDRGLPDRVVDYLQQANIRSDLFELEITESALMDLSVADRDVMSLFKSHGIKFIVDDFGSGFSNISSLKTANISAINIDRSLIQSIHTHLDSQEIIQILISLAHQLDVLVVSEGVETVEQIAFLSKLGCDCFQGFYFSKALTANAFFEYVKQQGALPS